MDIVMTGGWVVDGTGAPAYRADLAVRDGAVAAVGRLDHVEAARRIDCTGRYLMPGFVDTHVHGDAAVFDPDVQLAALSQGVTTFVAGQDGLSFAPSGPATMDYVRRYFGAINGDLPGGAAEGRGVGELLRGYDGTTPLNVGYLVPRGNLRLEAMGLDERAPSDGELNHMRRLLAQGMEEGALGLSTGLDYVPDRYGDTAELAALAAEAGRYGGLYVSHMRGYEAEAHVGVAEVNAIARDADVPAHISHYHGPAHMLVKLIDDSRAEGVDLTFDSYPYDRGASIVAMVGLPVWVQGGGTDATVARLRDAGVRARLHETWFPERPELYDRIAFAWVDHPDLAWCEGRTLTEAAETAGADPAEFLCDLLAATGLRASCVFRQPPTNTVRDIRALLRHPAHMAGSDGVFVGGAPHPRGWGAFARLLGVHTRELGDYTWGEAALHLAGHPARRFGLQGRGSLRPGMAADVVVLDPSTVADVATYADPRRPARGVDHVVVNGVEVLDKGRLTGAAPGQALRRTTGGLP
ncbi:D-aminoacylase [Actinomadura darangshiensis]|uniref:D-aminoacylase n=1 Tax=Actinomadura darangshiensis TaxID=705336 RepID=A0A4R5BP18_9ACTN|nr:amidohydrolase family protein [Actinomadura darangshiensis]TDD87639.1 D-aminoacylase [Actinomadura darangshiensis]